MDVWIEKSPLRGVIQAIPSKSDAHRALIAAALSQTSCEILLTAVSEDIEATVRALRALGASIQKNERGFLVSPIQSKAITPRLDCGESGSTLRFLLPVAAAISQEPFFTGHGKLPDRPVDSLLAALKLHGVSATSDRLPLTLMGAPRAGAYTIPGDVSSQFLSGLLFLLPLLQGDSTLHIQGEQVSSQYVEMTLLTLRRFGIRIDAVDDGYLVPGGQLYTSPERYAVEGDWSNAAFFLAAGVDVQGLDPASAQPDSAIRTLLNGLGGTIDVAGSPDLFPILAVCAAFHDGVTEFTGGARLRIKECDRLSAMASCLRAMGASLTEYADGMRIEGGKPLHGARLNGHNDHRIVMAMSIAGSRVGSVRIDGAEAVRKSYPDFFTDFQALGGKCSVL
ncbi:MAG: 3-phosphoshikimate 1-carboxyvinyltransferase [Eubacteriales bacterium]|nr:3-phosphoshikimate 1-carboxyvinyltransferase [Eubacteriales bacterium]